MPLNYMHNKGSPDSRIEFAIWSNALHFTEWLIFFNRYEAELSIRQSVEGDIAGLRKVIDDTNIGRMNLESEIEALKEELIYLKKNHDNVSEVYHHQNTHWKSYAPK